MENLIGKTFNYLTVIDGPIKKENSRKIYWLCQCQCGNQKIARGDQLKSGNTKSCGCYKNKVFIENNKKRQTLDLTGQRFGRLIALEKTDKRSSDGRVIWRCQCDCGNICEVDSHHLKSGNTQSCGCSKSKGELAISNLLLINNIPFETQKKFDTCRFKENNYLASFDFFVNNQYIIEYDGEQHFYYNNNSGSWNTKEHFMKVQEHDIFKNNWCKKNNIPIIRIPYTHLKDLCIEDLLLETSNFVLAERIIPKD